MNVKLYMGARFLFCVMCIALIAACPMPEPEPTVPGTMAAPTLEVGNEQLIALWTAPNNGGSEITTYHLHHSADGGTTWSEIIALAAPALNYIITDLTNGAAYEVQVRAVNAVGAGPWSESAVATLPALQTPATVPDAPAAPTFEAGNGQLSATWTAPTDNGGSEITGYELQYRTDAGAWTRITSGIACENSEGQAEVCHFSFSSYSPYIIHSITTDGTNYRLQVRAVNEQGAGEWSPFASVMLFFARQVPAGAPAFAFLPNEITAIIAAELSISLTTVGASNITVNNSGDITAVTPETTPDGVNPPTVDASGGLIIITVSADTTAGTYVIYDNNATGADDILFAEYFFVTESPQNKSELQIAVDAGISDWGQTANLNYIITTAVTNMSVIFSNKTTFNGDISNWDVSSVTNMNSMFTNASAFNNDISGWDVSQVTIMNYMFNSATAFNQELEEWKEHWTPETGNKLTTADPPKYTGAKNSMFDGSGVVTNTDGADTNKPTGVGTPSWYQ